jgi:hypothetical protein
MFADLATGHPQRFESMFGVSKLVDFWDGALKTNDDRLVGHPMRSKPDWKEKTIPIFVHGNGGRVSGQRLIDGAVLGCYRQLVQFT